jgi:hypothetical protein
MSELLTTDIAGKTRKPIRIWLWVALAVAGVLAANAHLIYVATMSQPACVDHLRPGEAKVARGQFSAAQSSCNAGDAP